MIKLVIVRLVKLVPYQSMTWNIPKTYLSLG